MELKTPVLIVDESGNALARETPIWLEKFIRKSDQTLLLVSHSGALIFCTNHIIALSGRGQVT